MLNYHLLHLLAPLNFRDETRTEPLDAYLTRVSPLLPGIPPNLLAQWLYRHWRGFESNWSFLDLARLRVEAALLDTNSLCQQVGSRHMEVIERWSELLRSNRYVQRSWLADYMCRQGSWPEPIIVLAPAAGECYPDGTPLPTPLTLLEGHHRLAYLRTLAEGNGVLQARHAVWVCRQLGDTQTFSAPLQECRQKF